MEKWQPLESVHTIHTTIKNEGAVRDAIGYEIWMNDIYTVFVRRGMKMYHDAPMATWLSIKRNDISPYMDWRHLQFIKNQLVGENHEGIQIFPLESRLVDASNQYHLWVLEQPGEIFPFGFGERMICEHPMAGGKQREWPENMRPADMDEMNEHVAWLTDEYLNKKSKTV